MCLRKLALLLGFVLLLGANTVAALGLGDLTLHSTLNEPFHAEIRLNNIGTLTRDEIIVAFASHDEFARNQLERHYFYNDFLFEIIMDGRVARVKITSHSIMREPFLNFIVEARWPTGRLQREYVVLMDMPERI